MVEEIRKSIIELKNLEQKIYYIASEQKQKEEFLKKEAERLNKIISDYEQLKAENEALKKELEECKELTDKNSNS